MFSLESPQRGNSNEYTQYTIFQYKKENIPQLSQLCNYGICSMGLKNEFETAISVRAIEVLLYLYGKIRLIILKLSVIPSYLEH